MISTETNEAVDPTITFEAYAWTADWLIAWLAAVGVTYRQRDVLLSWTDSPMPVAVFHAPDIETINHALPSVDELAGMVIARDLPELDEFPRKPSLEQFTQRARAARERSDLSLGATVSALGVDQKEDLFHSPFDPSVPRGITLHQRLVSARSAVADGEQLVDSMIGRATTSDSNGLGYDLRRLSSSCVPGDNLVTDPIAETMSFFGSLMFTQWGERTRGWQAGSAFKPGAFRWPTWTTPLDWCAIDALMDRFIAGRPSPVTKIYESVAYRPTATADTTRGFGSRSSLT